MSRPNSRVAVAFALALALGLAADAVRAQSPQSVETGAVPMPEAGGAVPATAADVPAIVVQEQSLPGGVLVPGSGFRYDATGRRDPFKSLLQLEKKMRDVSQLPPIQQFDLETVKVVGIVVDQLRGTQAMVRAPSGQTFVVRVGTIIGKNEGEIVEITLQGIRILEKFLDFMNRETRKETFLKSHPTAGK